MRILALLLGFMLAATACELNVSGDSIACAILTVEDVEGFCASGYGWTDEAENGVWITSDKWKPPVNDPHVALVSGWDRFATTFEEYAEYTAYVESFGVQIVWVEFATDIAAFPKSEIDILNAAVAQELGCALVPSAYMEGISRFDGIHPDPTGAEILAARLEYVKNDYIC